MDLLDDLNPAQREAVTHPGGPLLVLAGAGSGKTRVLIRRVARLLEDGVPPHRVLAFTFTNRAAREMRGRLEQRVGPEAAGALWVGTFHATAVRLLRREAAAAGLPRAFTIYDREDQEGVLREVMQQLELPEASYRPSQVLARISDAKNALVTPEECERVAVSPWEKQVARAYARYDAVLRANGALDFDDLIARSVRLLLLVTGRDRLLAGHPTLARSIELRNPYVDALSAVQVELLGRLRAPGVTPADAAALRTVIGVTINGIAAGLQNTG